MSYDMGSLEWAKTLKKQTRSLNTKLETGFMRLAELLFLAWNTPVDNVETNDPVFTYFGCASFEEYADMLGIHRRKASFLRRIYYVLEIVLKDLDPALRKRLAALGYSKNRVLTRVLTMDNAEKWADLAEELRYVDLQSAVRKYEEELAEAEARQRDQNDAPDPEATGEVAVPDVEAVESWRYVEFSMTEDMVGIVEQALERAAAVSGSSHKGNLLQYVCMDYLAGQGSLKKGDDAFQAYLNGLERMFKVRLVALDSDQDTNVIYGGANLQKLARGLAERDQPAPAVIAVVAEEADGEGEEL